MTTRSRRTSQARMQVLKQEQAASRKQAAASSFKSYGEVLLGRGHRERERLSRLRCLG